MYEHSLPITLITGYLGAGKTAVLNHILHEKQGCRVAVIVNDIGEVNIDAALIEKGGAITQKEDNVVPLTNGCICCTLKEDLVLQINELAKTGRFDAILIEASGVCEPIPIAQTITLLNEACKQKHLPSICHLDNIVAVADALRLVKEFSCGKDFSNTDWSQEDSEEEESIQNLLVQQLEFCSTVLINKADLVTPDELRKIHAMVHALSPEAVILESSFGSVPVQELFNTHRFDFERVRLSAGWIHALEHPEEEEEPETLEYGIHTFVYDERRPLNRERFQAFLRRWPKEIIRSKGFLWFSDLPARAMLFEQASTQFTLTDNGPWIDALPADEKAALFRQEPQLKQEWDEQYGDRLVKLVFIGQNMNETAIHKELNDCLDN